MPNSNNIELGRSREKTDIFIFFLSLRCIVVDERFDESDVVARSSKFPHQYFATGNENVVTNLSKYYQNVALPILDLGLKCIVKSSSRKSSTEPNVKSILHRTFLRDSRGACSPLSRSVLRRNNLD